PDPDRPVGQVLAGGLEPGGVQPVGDDPDVVVVLAHDLGEGFAGDGDPVSEVDGFEHPVEGVAVPELPALLVRLAVEVQVVVVEVVHERDPVVLADPFPQVDGRGVGLAGADEDVSGPRDAGDVAEGDGVVADPAEGVGRKVAPVVAGPGVVGRPPARLHAGVCSWPACQVGSQFSAYHLTVSAMPSARGLRLAGSMPMPARVDVSAVTGVSGVSPGRMGRLTTSTGGNPRSTAALMTSAATSRTWVWSTEPTSTGRSSTVPPAAASRERTRASAPSRTQ